MAGSQRLLVAVEVPAQLQNNLSSQQHAETIIVETATSIVRKRPRRSKPATKVVNYIESSDDEADMARASKRAKRVITDAEVRQVTNQMSRERLEGFIER